MALTDEPDDIGADIALAMKGDEPAAIAPAEPILPADTQDPAEETAQEKADRVRDEHGRFAKAEETAQDAPAQAQEPAKPTILPPRSWTAAAKAKFATLDPDVQQEVLRREGEIDAGKQQWDTKAERYNRLEAAIAPHRDRLTLSGVEESVYIARLAQADKMLTENPYQAIQEVARMYGIDLAQVNGQQFSGGPPQGQPYQDPQYQTLAQEVQALRAERQQEITQRQALEQQSAQAQIEAFANDPANLYFDNVKPEIAALLQSGAAKDLPQAYEMACHARPDIRALLQATAAARPSTLTRPGGPQVTGAQRGATPPASSAANQNSSIDDDVRAAMNELAGRV